METTLTVNIEAVHHAMPHWPLDNDDLTRDGDDLRSIALRAIRQVDHSLAYGSETVGYGNALDDLSARSAPTEQAILDNLTWWDQAYQAWYLTTPDDGQGHGGGVDEDDEPCPQGIVDAIYELIFSGSSDLALALAERWSNGDLTPDEQVEYGVCYDES